MKLKKAGVILIAAAVICGLTACGGKEKETAGEVPEQSVETGETENAGISEDEAGETGDGKITDGETEEPETGSVVESDEDTAGASMAAAEGAEFTPVAGLSENYADLENRSFAYNGKIFTLGESTLQDLIDGGIPFKKDELSNIGNNINSNYETDRYTVEINDYVSMQFAFVNTTETNITEAECLLSLVRWHPLYVSQPDYEDSMNEEITELIDDAAAHVCFSFPLTLTKEQLLENNGDASEVDEYNNVYYMIESEIYMGDSGYSFEFNKATNQLENVSISWLP